MSSRPNLVIASNRDSRPAEAAERDLRIDLFRGLALWLIFLDHIPANIVSWITIRNYGFSDAAVRWVCPTTIAQRCARTRSNESAAATT
jgi:hypothetical protein